VKATCDAHPLLAREIAHHEHMALAERDGVGVFALRHLSIVQNFVLLGQVDVGVLLGRQAIAGDKN
jgi:hypothetical protein